MSRERVFTLISSVPLEPDTVTPDKFTVGGTAPNARVRSVTPVDGSDNTVFTVVALADDSGTISISLPTGTVKTPGGFANLAPSAASTTVISGTPVGTKGDTLAFVNPIDVSPQGLALVVGDQKGQNYSISLLSGAPLPLADLAFEATLDSGNSYPMTLSTMTPDIQVGANSTVVTITAPDGNVPSGGAANLITHTLSSNDPQYDGLYVPNVRVAVYETDPYLFIQKQAFTDVLGSNDPSNIVATGKQSASGGRITDGTNVWFVFHVCNISQATATATGTPSWVTDLSDVQVTDDVLGPITTIASLPAHGANCVDIAAPQNPVAISANQ